MDRLECGVFGLKPEPALELAAIGSLKCWTGDLDGKPEAMFGVTADDLLSGIGRPWLLGTDRSIRAGRAWLTVAPSYVEQMAQGFRLLENWVHQSNIASQHWLRRLGFTIETEAQAVSGAPMLKFWKLT
jgi:ribosomal protein S18 acetylase RimI-like enzyme